MFCVRFLFKLYDKNDALWSPFEVKKVFCKSD